jgi:hypothetical protein
MQARGFVSHQGVENFSRRNFFRMLQHSPSICIIKSVFAIPKNDRDVENAEIMRKEMLYEHLPKLPRTGR